MSNNGESWVCNTEEKKQHALNNLKSRSVPFRFNIIDGLAAKSSDGMKGLWRIWMAQTAEWMSARGAKMPLFITASGELSKKTRPFDKDDAHKMFMSLWGGLDESGDREHQEHAYKDAMFHIMQQHEAWATEKGLLLTIPKNSRYKKLRDEQHAI